MKKYDAILSIFLIAAGAAGICMAMDFQAKGGNAGDPGPAFWPIMLCCGLILCSLVLLVQTAVGLKKEGGGQEPLIDYRSAGVRCVLTIFVIMIGYAVLLYLFGFIPATLLFVACTMLAMGERRVVWIALTTAGITGFIYLLFAVIMNVILPKGTLF